MKRTRHIIHTLFLASVVGVLLATPSRALALKKRVRGPRVVGVSYSSVKLNRGTHSAVVSFFNLAKVKRIEYELDYETSGRPQGVIGSFVPSGQSTDGRDLYFGTCSKGVCTAHYNITNATLTVTTTLTSGGTNAKRYRFKNV